MFILYAQPILNYSLHYNLTKWTVYIRIIRCSSNKVMYDRCGLVQLFLFRIQLYVVRVPVECSNLIALRQIPTASFAGSSLVRSLGLPASLTVGSRESYT